MKIYEKVGKYYYFLSDIGSEMNSVISRATKIRSIKIHKDSKIIFEKILC